LSRVPGGFSERVVVAVAVRGRILRFDQVRGYGFIAPDAGGEDVFVHVNDLLNDKHLAQPGAVVEFDVERSDRGLTASKARIVKTEGDIVSSLPRPVVAGPRPSTELGEEEYEILSEPEFSQEVTELLIRAEPTLTGQQIMNIRHQLGRLALKYGWIEN
jgi:cold shock protein